MFHLKKQPIIKPANEHPALLKKAEFHPEPLNDRVSCQDSSFQIVSKRQSCSNPPGNGLAFSLPKVV